MSGLTFNDILKVVQGLRCSVHVLYEIGTKNVQRS